MPVLFTYRFNKDLKMIFFNLEKMSARTCLLMLFLKSFSYIIEGIQHHSAAFHWLYTQFYTKTKKSSK